jgi:polyphosphate kinase
LSPTCWPSSCSACRETFGEDLTALFNLVTGYTRPAHFHHLLVAPTHLREGLVARVRREADHARAGRPARLIDADGRPPRRSQHEFYALAGGVVR